MLPSACPVRTPVDRVPTLLEWCRANNCEILAPQLPGRGARTKEPFIASVQARDEW